MPVRTSAASTRWGAWTVAVPPMLAVLRGAPRASAASATVLLTSWSPSSHGSMGRHGPSLMAMEPTSHHRCPVTLMLMALTAHVASRLLMTSLARAPSAPFRTEATAVARLAMPRPPGSAGATAW
eukprot:9540878-Alexandrium_andersonii.AAC.1